MSTLLQLVQFLPKRNVMACFDLVGYVKMPVLYHGQRASRRASEAAHRTENASYQLMKDHRVLTACESHNPSSTFLIYVGCVQPVSTRYTYISCVRIRCMSRVAFTRKRKTLASCTLVSLIPPHEHTHGTGMTSCHLAPPRIWSRKSLLCNLYS